MEGLEVEKRSATSYSSIRARGSPEKLKVFLSFSFLHYALGLHENRCRIGSQLRTGDNDNGHKQDISSIVCSVDGSCLVSISFESYA
jgi:hypothetical protein